MEWTAVVSLVCLGVAAPLCLAGVFCNAYRESWLQFWGLWGISCWGFSRIEVIAERGYTDPWNLALHAGLAAYSIGTALKVLRHSKPPRRGPRGDDLPEIARENFRHVAGGTKE